METDENEKILYELQNAQVIAISQLDKRKACLRCKARVEPSAMEGFRRCSKPECAMLQTFDFCSNQISVKLLLMAEGKIHSLSAYGKLVLNLVDAIDCAQVTDEILMLLPILKTVTYNNGNVITNFSK